MQGVSQATEGMLGTSGMTGHFVACSSFSVLCKAVSGELCRHTLRRREQAEAATSKASSTKSSGSQ